MTVVLNTVADNLLGALDGFVSGDRPVKDRFVSLARPPMDCCDSLSVWVNSVSFSTGFPGGGPVVHTGHKCVGVTVVDFGWQILRQCWPTSTQAEVFPSPDRVDAAAQLLLEDGAALWCGLLSVAGSSDVFSLNNVAPLRTIINPMVPVPPAGGCAGWLGSVQVEFNECCVFPEPNGSGS